MLANKNTADIKSKLYKAMRYKSAKKDQFVFKYGEYTNFVFVLKISLMSVEGILALSCLIHKNSHFLTVSFR